MAVYRCAGNRRLDYDGNPLCSFEAKKPWPGRCPQCRQPYSILKIGADIKKQKRVTAADALGAFIRRTPTGLDHFDYVMSGGLAKDHAILFAGPKGSGKSTLMTMVLDSFSRRLNKSVLFASAEEYTDAILANVNRVGAAGNDLLEIIGCDVTRNVHTIIDRCREYSRAAVVFDSLQAMTFEDMPASPRRDVAVADVINNYCKKSSTPCIVMNHMSKSLEVTGATTVGHYFDTELEIHHFLEINDGKKYKLFDEETLSRVKLDDIRTLIVGKIRGGNSFRKVFFLTTATGLHPLAQKSEDDLSRRRLR